jgi:prolyl 4-hydroxylase
MDRARIGASVHDRLAATPGIQAVPAPDLDLFILRDFLDAPLCEALIGLIDARRAPSPLFADNPDPGFRTSETCNLDPRDPNVAETDRRLIDLLGVPAEHGERLQGQRYGEGQRFKPHHDYLRVGEAYWSRQETIGGQRTWTAMVFLDVPARGGETHFPRAELTIRPRRGSLVAWNNLDREGEPNPATLHQGLPVIEGVKHIVTKWHRERPWGVAAPGAQNG